MGWRGCRHAGKSGRTPEVPPSSRHPATRPPSSNQGCQRPVVIQIWTVASTTGGPSPRQSWSRLGPPTSPGNRAGMARGARGTLCSLGMRLRRDARAKCRSGATAFSAAGRLSAPAPCRRETAANKKGRRSAPFCLPLRLSRRPRRLRRRQPATAPPATTQQILPKFQQLAR